MKDLRGTEKQIALAESIRQDALDTIKMNIDLAEERIKQFPKVEIYRDDLEIFTQLKKEYEDAFDKIEEASVIIDSHNNLNSDGVIYKYNQISLKRQRERMWG